MALDLRLDGIRDVLGMWVGENESAEFWLTILNSLKNGGVDDILIACVGGLPGFINALKRFIHIRNTTRYISHKDIKQLMADLKLVYSASNEKTALYELDEFENKWSGKYAKIADSRRTNWPALSTYFKSLFVNKFCFSEGNNCGG